MVPEARSVILNVTRQYCRVTAIVRPRFGPCQSQGEVYQSQPVTKDLEQKKMSLRDLRGLRGLRDCMFLL